MRLLKLKTVLAATDLDTSSDPALETAARLAKAAGADLHVAHIVSAAQQAARPTPPQVSDPTTAIALQLRRIGISDENAEVHVEEGAPDKALSLISEEIDADVIVIGRHRGQPAGQRDDPIGSTAHSIVARTLAPCLVTSHVLQLPLRRALVAIDTSEAARGAMIVALSWASALRGPSVEGEPALTVLHVETGEERSSGDARMKRTIDHELDILKRSAGAWAGVTVAGATEPGRDPAEAIVEYAADHAMELVVLGTRGLSADIGLRIGSVSAAISRKLRAPLLMVPPSVWRDYARDIDYL